MSQLTTTEEIDWEDAIKEKIDQGDTFEISKRTLKLRKNGRSKLMSNWRNKEKRLKSNWRSSSKSMRRSLKR